MNALLGKNTEKFIIHHYNAIILESPLSCDQCGRNYASSKSLMAHKTTHSSQEAWWKATMLPYSNSRHRYTCPLCTKDYKTKAEVLICLLGHDSARRFLFGLA